LLIFGGSFDPPHIAHAALPPLVADRLGCARILYVPASVSPHKTDDAPRANAHHRLAMLAMAIADIPNADISTAELERIGPSYTIDTLRHLRSLHAPDITFRLLIGTDQALRFHTWKEWSAILELATPAVMLRAPLDERTFHQQLVIAFGEDEAARWLEWTVRVPTIDASSTEIRQRLLSGKALNDAIDPAVLRYIQRERLYGTAAVVRSR
jgi:nicotinate-nucleotide adenylyltransferase